MALTPKERYQREVARAKALGYSTPYQMRKARAIERGLSPTPKRNRDYALERERRNIRARAQGFRSLYEKQKYNKLSGSAKEKALKYFGITEKQFNDMRRENRHYTNEVGQLRYTAINAYDMKRDAETSNWDINRVGYIVYFNKAIVNPKTNYDAVAKEYRSRDGRKGRKMDMKNATAEQYQAQFYYLVFYGGLMEVDEWESRYGLN